MISHPTWCRRDINRKDINSKLNSTTTTLLYTRGDCGPITERAACMLCEVLSADRLAAALAEWLYGCPNEKVEGKVKKYSYCLNYCRQCHWLWSWLRLEAMLLNLAWAHLQYLDRRPQSFHSPVPDTVNANLSIYIAQAHRQATP